MQIEKSGLGYALCSGLGHTRRVNTQLIGDQPPGTWLLVFLDSAREVLDPIDAVQITQAVQALDLVMSAHSSHELDRAAIDNLFADLVNREPAKPPSLLALEQIQQEPAKGD